MWLYLENHVSEIVVGRSRHHSSGHNWTKHTGICGRPIGCSVRSRWVKRAAPHTRICQRPTRDLVQVACPVDLVLALSVCCSGLRVNTPPPWRSVSVSRPMSCACLPLFYWIVNTESSQRPLMPSRNVRAPAPRGEKPAGGRADDAAPPLSRLITSLSFTPPGFLLSMAIEKN